MMRLLRRLFVTVLVLAGGVLLAEVLPAHARQALHRVWQRARAHVVHWWQAGAPAAPATPPREPEPDPDMREFATQLARMQQAQQVLADSLAQLSARTNEAKKRAGEDKR
jgi:hypothetical protein